ncbi:MAG: hypothetical protein JKY34_07425 [Kordiimonadaceae bacterium]|nr:hypothetical protein [Kordiimonadaceae bacterium]
MPRRTYAPPIKEDALHILVADFLNKISGSPLAPKLLWCHVPNGEYRTKATAAKLKRMGTLAGVWDILIWGPGGTYYFIELKRPTLTGARRKPLENQLEEPQAYFKRALVALGVPPDRFAVADSIELVRSALKLWKLLPCR